MRSVVGTYSGCYSSETFLDLTHARVYTRDSMRKLCRYVLTTSTARPHGPFCINTMDIYAVHRRFSQLPTRIRSRVFLLFTIRIQTLSSAPNVSWQHLRDSARTWSEKRKGVWLNLNIQPTDIIITLYSFAFREHGCTYLVSLTLKIILLFFSCYFVPWKYVFLFFNCRYRRYRWTLK